MILIPLIYFIELLVILISLSRTHNFSFNKSVVLRAVNGVGIGSVADTEVGNHDSGKTQLYLLADVLFVFFIQKLITCCLCFLQLSENIVFVVSNLFLGATRFFSDLILSVLFLNQLAETLVPRYSIDCSQGLENSILRFNNRSVTLAATGNLLELA